MSDIFISYARENRDRAGTLAKALEDHGWSVWWDRSILAGESFDVVIAEALSTAKCVVVLWSRESVHSDWVRDEAGRAKDRDVLVPVFIDKVRQPLGFGRIQTEDLTGWRGDATHPAFHNVARAVEAVMAEPGSKKRPRRTSLELVTGEWPRQARRFMKKRPVVFGAALSTLAAVVVAAVFRVPSTAIELALAVSEFSYATPSRQPLADGIKLQELGMSGLTGIEIPPALGRRAQVHSASAALLRVATRDGRTGSLEIDDLVAQPSTRVGLRKTEIPDQYRLSLLGAQGDLGVLVSGPIHVIVPRSFDAILDFPIGYVRMLTDSTGVDLDFKMAEGQAEGFMPRLPTVGLSVLRVDQFVDRQNPDVIAEVSTIESGALSYKWSGREFLVAKGDEIRFKNSVGEIRGLGLTEDHIAFTFSGRVSGMRLGSGAASRNLMPTLLQRLIRRTPSL